MSLPYPDYYDPASIDRVYMERAQDVARSARAFRAQHNVRPSGRDDFKIAAFGIDCQIGFCAPGASLFVPGAVEDMQRTLAWLYGNMDKITGLHFSMDTHRVFQIFHPAWWLDKDGNHPEPFTVVSAGDLKSGRWTPIAHPAQCLEYTKQLEADGKYVLTIWPFHTLLGGVSHALMPALMEAAIFHSVLRMRQTHFETKGTHAMTENYSVMSPEVKALGGQPVGGFNAAFFKMLMEYDRIYVFGQAKSHCVLSTLRDLKARILSTDPKMVEKVWILEDAMSPVPPPPLKPLPPELDFPKVADQAILEFRAAGMKVVKTTDEILPR